MTSLAKVTETMKELNTVNAPGSETFEWGVFCDAAREEYGVMPYDEDENEIEVSDEFASYWTAISNEDYEAAAKHGDIDWIKG